MSQQTGALGALSSSFTGLGLKGFWYKGIIIRYAAQEGAVQEGLGISNTSTLSLYVVYGLGFRPLCMGPIASTMGCYQEPTKQNIKIPSTLISEQTPTRNRVM